MMMKEKRGISQKAIVQAQITGNIRGEAQGEGGAMRTSGINSGTYTE
jgi:hypothetical protein